MMSLVSFVNEHKEEERIDVEEELNRYLANTTERDCG